MTKYQNQSQQDYLECILTLSKEKTAVHRVDIAKNMSVSQAAVNKAMKILAGKGYIYEDGKHLFLTEQGLCYAEEIYEKHCIIRGFLQKLGVSATQAEEDACRMEHVVSEETFRAMRNYVNK